jgi:hypothetical protein
MRNTPIYTLNTVQQEILAWKKLLLFSPPAPVDKILSHKTPVGKTFIPCNNCHLYCIGKIYTSVMPGLDEMFV